MTIVGKELADKSKTSKFNFGENVDIVKGGSATRMRIPLKWDHLEGIGHGGNHVVQNWIAKLVAKLTESPSGTRQYSYLDYRLFAAAIFVDPPGTSSQEFHEDLVGLDRLAVWNLMIPIQLPADQKCTDNEFALAQSLFRSKEHCAQEDTDAVAWDANWKHRGLGNPSQCPYDKGVRVQLHLICAPQFFLLPIQRSLGPASPNDPVKGVPVSAIIHAQNEIAREYNHGINVFYENGTDKDRELHEAYVRNSLPGESKNWFYEARHHHDTEFKYTQEVIDQTLQAWKYTRGSLAKDTGTEIGYFVRCLCDSVFTT
jgi:hypothetical protein